MNIVLRPAVIGDRFRLYELWRIAFGDSDEYIDCFFAACPDPERVLVLEDEGGVQAMTAWFDMPLVSEDGGQWPGAYLYAVATHPDCRGKGYAGMLLKWAGEWLQSRGFACLTTVPASGSLHRFFAANGFAEQFVLVEQELVPDMTIAPAPLAAVEWQEYGSLRERALARTAHAACGGQGLAYQQAVCRLSGGGLFRAGSGCACVERAGDTAVVKELLAPEGEHPAILSALAQRISARRWLVRTPCKAGQEGKPFAMVRWLMEQPTQWPDGPAYFGLAFD
ncbi:MAG: GNAT family N-acetyltransferase [Oscillospiraceae bacterium]|nr:GNAT family N-acetyltransferase [Oscillospiraceae bacterium]